MREIKSKSFSAMVEHTLSFEYMDIGHGIAIYRFASGALVTSKRPPKVFSCYKGEMHQGAKGFCSLADAEKMSSGKTTSVKDLFPKEILYLGDAEMLDIISKTVCGSSEQCEQLKAYTDTDPWTIAALRDVIPLRFNCSDNSWLNVNGDFIPQGIKFSYMHGDMHDGRYDLTKVLAVLKNDPRITFVDFDRKRWEQKRAADDILPIPYYNVDSNHSQQISFIFAPTANDMVKINEWYKALTDTNKYWSRCKYVGVRVLDLLNIEQFNIAKED